MAFDPNYLSKPQKKVAQHAIKSVEKNLKFGKPTSSILGLNPYYGVQELEEADGVEIKFESKELENEIKLIRTYADQYVKVVFKFEETLKELVLLSTTHPHEQYNALHYLWSGVIDFPISDQFVFGRIAPNLVPSFRTGTYCFVPFEIVVPEIQEQLDRVIRDTHVEDFLDSITKGDGHSIIFNKLRDNWELLERMRGMPKQIETRASMGNEVIDEFNKNPSLRKILSHIGHLGSTVIRALFISRIVDILRIMPDMKFRFIGAKAKAKFAGLGVLSVAAVAMNPAAAGLAAGAARKEFMQAEQIIEFNRVEISDAFTGSNKNIFTLMNVSPPTIGTPECNLRLGPPNLRNKKERTEMDISLLGIPGNFVSLLQMANYSEVHDPSLKAFNLLINELYKIS